jgi:hypothetical protein
MVVLVPIVELVSTSAGKEKIDATLAPLLEYDKERDGSHLSFLHFFILTLGKQRSVPP